MSIFKRKKAIKIGIVSYSSSEIRKLQSTIASYISDHSQAFKSVMDYLSGKYELETVLTEDLQKYERLFKKYIRILILPQVVVITQEQLNNLEAFVKLGGDVLADFPSFAFDKIGDGRKRSSIEKKIPVRLRNVLGIEAIEAEVSVRIDTQYGGYDNLFAGSPPYVPYQGEAILVPAAKCHTHGRILIDDVKNIQSTWTADQLTNAESSCLVFKNPDYTGYFIYSTIPLCRNIQFSGLGVIFDKLFHRQEKAIFLNLKSKEKQEASVIEQLRQDLRLHFILISVCFIAILFILKDLYLPEKWLPPVYEKLGLTLLGLSVAWLAKFFWKHLKK